MNEWKQKFKQRLPVIVLMAITLIFWSLYDRYERVGPVLLESPTLEKASYMRGDSTETNGCFRLARLAKQKTASVHFRMPAGADHPLVRVLGRIKVNEVVEGQHSWNCARLLLVQRNEKNGWITGPHNVVSEWGDLGWAFHQEVFEIDPRAMHMDLVMEQLGRSGVALFDQLLVEPVRVRPSFVVWRTLFACLWIFMAGLYFRRCRLHKRKLKWLILLNVLAILAGTLMPSLWIRSSTDRVKTELSKMFYKSPPVAPELSSPKPKPIRNFRIEQFEQAVGEIHKTGHFILFASLCFWVYCSAALERQHPIYFLKVGFDVLLFAAITEVLQHLTLDRTAGILDLRTDLYGMATAFILFLLIRPLLLKNS